jgi:hypothetical protein
MIITPAEDKKINDLKKRLNSFDLGSSAEIAGHMHFLHDIARRLKTECDRLERDNERLTHENKELHIRIKNRR